jgi:two-component system sensor histidine kinase FlrB
MLGHTLGAVGGASRVLPRGGAADSHSKQLTDTCKAPPRDEQEALDLCELFDQLPAGVVVLDPQGCVRRSNPAALALLGTPLTGEPWRDVIDRAFAPRADDGHDLSLLDGRRVAIDTRALYREPGQLLLLTDVTETRRLQEANSRRERLETLGQMISALVHQVRSPLTAALLYAGHLTNASLTADERMRFGRKLLLGLRDMERLVRELLVFARGGTLRTERVPVRTLLEELIQRNDHRLSDLRAELSCHCDNAIEIVGNREALATALENLLVNALQAAGEGARVQIRVQRLDRQWLQISISDNGPGIPAQERARIFEPFHTTRNEGTGLGLAVVRAVVEAHGGRVDVDGARPGGACFRVMLGCAMARVEVTT